MFKAEFLSVSLGSAHSSKVEHEKGLKGLLTS